MPKLPNPHSHSDSDSDSHSNSHSNSNNHSNSNSNSNSHQTSCPCSDECCTTATVNLTAQGNVSAVSANLLAILADCGITIGGTPPTEPTFEAVFTCLCNAGLRFVTIFTRASVPGGVALFVFCD